MQPVGDIYHQMYADTGFYFSFAYYSLICHIVVIFIAPLAQILGAPKISVEKGKTINLTCTTGTVKIPPTFVTWYHQNEVNILTLIIAVFIKSFTKHFQIINYDSNRGGLSILTEKTMDSLVSYLLIRNATDTDAGKYSCSLSNSDIVSIELEIINGT